MNQSFYYWYEAAHAMLSPARAGNDALRSFYSNPANPFSHTPVGRNMAAACELFERVTRRYGKPRFDLASTVVDGALVSVDEKIVWSKPFCNLIRMDRRLPPNRKPDPKLLIVAPMSGHYATLLRGTVEAFLPQHDVYITDWQDARMVPLASGTFDLDSYIDYVIEMMQLLGPDVHVLAVCQPSVPVIAAVARMEAVGDPLSPRSMILMGGPLDTRRSPTAVNKLAEERGTNWFRNNCVVKVPFPHAGVGRDVYPGFLQLGGFMAMNFDRHMTAHWDMFKHLVQDDGDSADKHREFYDEYLAVMDLTAEFYLQTVDTVFVQHALPKGTMMHRDKPVDLTAIRKAALMTVEGEKDDISGIGQTQAAHDLCVNIPADRKIDHMQKNVGHYGVFNGSRFRSEIAPKISSFIAAHQAAYSAEEPQNVVQIGKKRRA
jgi:poly(3-hydroxybutyrate) depolymerase